jgi:hypothetical protein
MDQTLFLKIIFASAITLVFWHLFIRQFYQMFRDDKNLLKAKKELPVMAKELNLKHKKGNELGSYHGKWNNHQIRIEPNHYDASISIKAMEDPQFQATHTGISEIKYDLSYLFTKATKLIIRFIPDYPVEQSPQQKFSFGDQFLDNYFQERQLRGEKGKETALDPELQKTIKDFLIKNRKMVKNLYIGQEVACSLWVGCSSGKTRLYSVTGKQVKTMLTEMYPIVDCIERVLKN